jgi:hypothetical protein
LDQVGVIAEKAGDGSDEHYAQLAQVATVTQLRTAVKQEPPPEPEPTPDEDDDNKPDDDPDDDPAPPPGPERSITRTSDATHTYWRITLPHADAATFDAALAAHRDALIAERKHDHDNNAHPGDHAPLPTAIDAFTRLIEAGWDAEATRRPHGHHTTVVVHLDLAHKIANLHRGPLLSDDDRRYLLCDATAEVWFERDGQPIGAARTTRTISRRLRRALEHRDHCCVVPGCGATRGLHAHHIIHWEDGGDTELDNLVMVCPYHHRAHHRSLITITGPATRLVVTDYAGRRLKPGSLARPPTTAPPAVPPYQGPTGERAHWKWYHPYEPQPPPSNN